MRQSLLSRLTYANVVASLALFLALGGVGYAATEIAANSVGTAQLKANAVTGPKVKNGSLTASDLTAAARTALTGPAGAAGPAGADGAAGISAAYGTTSGAKAVKFDATAGKATTVASLALPAGSYSIVAKVVANNDAKAGRKAVRCQLVSGSTVYDDGGAFVYLGANNTTDRAAIPLTATAVLAADATVSISCTSTSVAGSYLGPMIVADQVGSIGGTSSDGTGTGTGTTTTGTTTTSTTPTTTTGTTTTDTTTTVTPEER